jgi:hypothetical protein
MSFCQGYKEMKMQQISGNQEKEEDKKVLLCGTSRIATG